MYFYIYAATNITDVLPIKSSSDDDHGDKYRFRAKTNPGLPAVLYYIKKFLLSFYYHMRMSNENTASINIYIYIFLFTF